MTEETLQGFIDTAIAQLDYLDPIMGHDLQFICATRPIDNGMLKVLIDECLERANIWPQCIMRQAWNNVLDCLSSISDSAEGVGV